MRVGIYADPHITKRMGSLQDHWEKSVIHTFEYMYDMFDRLGVDKVICLGDMFDKAVLEARSVNLVNRVTEIMNSRIYTTYLLLGNHEIDSVENNILEYFDGLAGVIPVTRLTTVGPFLFIPYGESISSDEFNTHGAKYAVTHHDFYGVELAGGKVRASFGDDPNLMKDFKIVFNGHIHTQSELGNILNAGSVLCSQHGVLREGEFPRFYIYDTDRETLESFYNPHSLVYWTVNPRGLDKFIESDESNSGSFILRVEYTEGEDMDTEGITLPDNVLDLQFKKHIQDTSLEDTKVERSVLDVKDIMKRFIDKDISLIESMKDLIYEEGVKMLEENKV